MRIAGLHLQAYGHFTGCSLDFGQDDGARANGHGPGSLPESLPGLHLVYGHNEAGKSTTLRALSSVLFGYPHGIVDGFKHDARDIAIGIDLVAAGGRPLSFVRRRRGRHALTAADGSALDDATVANFLGGVSRDVFEKVFALDHQRLREHAQALLADGGALGFSLVEAGSGIAGLKAVLEGLKRERGDLFLPGGARPALNRSIAEYIKLRKDARQFTVSPSEYHNHEKGIQETGDELQRLRAQRKEIESAIVRLQRIQKNLPLRAEHRALTRRIEALDGVPLLPPEFTQSRIRASADLEAARTDLDAATAAIGDLERRITAVAVDDDILARGEDIGNLAQRRPVIEKELAESPKWEAEREQLETRAGNLMAGAGIGGGAAGPAGRLPPALKRKAIQMLAEAGNRLTTQRAIARTNAEAAARSLNKARDRAAQLPKPSPAGELSRALTAADKLGPVTADIARRTRALDRRTKALGETIVGLGLPPGGHVEEPASDRVARLRVDWLRALPIPPEKTEARYAETFAQASRELDKALAAFERLDDDLAETNARIATIRIAGDIATEDDLKAARQARDHGWELVRGLFVDCRQGIDEAIRRFAPDGRVAETYEAQVRAADQAVDTLRAHVGESTELALRKRQAADLETRRAAAAQAMKTQAAQRDAVLSEWRALWPAGLVTMQSPGEMIDWMARRKAVLAAADEVEEEHDAVRGLMDRERDGRLALAAAMMAFGVEARDLDHAGDLDALRERARSLIDAAARAKTAYDKADADVRLLSDRKAEMDEEAERLDVRAGEWMEAWRTALAEAGLPVDLTAETAAATLDIINEVDSLKSKIDGLSRHVDAVRAGQDAFGGAVAGIAAAFPGAPPGTAVAVCRWLEERLRTARRAEVERNGLVEQLEARTVDRDRAHDRLRCGGAALAVLCAQAGGGPDELADIERRAADKRDALRDRERIETRVREDGGGRDFIDLFAECDDVAGDGIVADLIGLKADRDGVETRIDALTLERAKLQAAFDSLLGQNQAAGLTQEAKALEAEIEETVESYVDLTVQETLLRAAIDVYRDRNQGPILTRARDLFVQLTDGAYAGLRADVERGETVLIVEDPARGSLELDALSDGTVDAVYLALRLAVVQEHNATHEPLPFIADDLLLNLDNRRSEAALRTLARLAATTQVLLFTHHAHMAELARRAVPPDILVEHSLSPPIGRTGRLRAAS
jgi:uncharacterized protein YhaN